MVDEPKKTPELSADERIDLLLAHLGGTTVPSAALAPHGYMNAKQGVQMIRLIQPDLTIPIQDNNYDVFASPLQDFKKEVEKAGLEGKVVYLDRGEKFEFTVEKESNTGGQQMARKETH